MTKHNTFINVDAVCLVQEPRQAVKTGRLYKFTVY